MELAKALREHNAQQHDLVERGIVAANIANALEASLAPEGTYNIPLLLELKRKKYGIPNGAFECFPVFDKVYVYQIPLNERTTYSDGGAILKPEAIIASDRNTAPRGVIVSAGLQALDSLRSTGIDVGHTIRFKKFAPFIQPVGEIQGKELTVMVIRDGDIVSSEELAQLYHSRSISLLNVSPDATGFDHRFARTHGEDVVHTGKKVSAYYDPST